MIGLADKLADKVRGRCIVKACRCADLLDPSLVQHDHAIRQFHGLLLVMGHKNGGMAGLAMQGPEPLAQVFADLGIKRAEGLVQQQNARLNGKGAGDGNPLSLPARQLRGKAMTEIGQLHKIQQVLHTAGDLRLRWAELAWPHP